MSVLALGSGLRAPTAPSERGSAPLSASDVAVPITLAHAGIAALLSPGQLVDLVAMTEQGPFVIASGATVLRGASQGGFATSEGSVVLMSLDRVTALKVLAQESAMSVLLREAPSDVPFAP